MSKEYSSELKSTWTCMLIYYESRNNAFLGLRVLCDDFFFGWLGVCYINNQI